MRKNNVEFEYLGKPFIMWSVGDLIFAKWHNTTWLAAVEAGTGDNINLMRWVAINPNDLYLWGDGHTYQENKWLVSQNEENMNTDQTFNFWLNYKQTYLSDREFDNEEI